MSRVRRELERTAWLWRISMTPKLYVWLVAELFAVLGLLILTFLSGDSPSSVIKATLIVPSMLLLALMCSEVFAGMREGGELELIATHADPGRVVLHRLSPVLAVIALQFSALVVVLVFLIGPLEVLAGCVFAAGPLLFALSTSLYWNLRLTSASSVLTASFATLLPAIVWVVQAQMLRETGSYHLSLGSIAVSFIRCDVGLALAALGLAALAKRRIAAIGEVLDAS